MSHIGRTGRSTANWKIHVTVTYLEPYFIHCRSPSNGDNQIHLGSAQCLGSGETQLSK